VTDRNAQSPLTAGIRIAVLKRWLALSGGPRAWSGAVTVLALTAVLVVLDISVGSVHRYWSRHSFTSSVRVPVGR
jgi:hypothetical protein